MLGLGRRPALPGCMEWLQQLPPRSVRCEAAARLLLLLLGPPAPRACAR